MDAAAADAADAGAADAARDLARANTADAPGVAAADAADYARGDGYRHPHDFPFGTPVDDQWMQLEDLDEIDEATDKEITQFIDHITKKIFGHGL